MKGLKLGGVLEKLTVVIEQAPGLAWETAVVRVDTRKGVIFTLKHVLVTEEILMSRDALDPFSGVPCDVTCKDVTDTDAHSFEPDDRGIGAAAVCAHTNVTLCHGTGYGKAFFSQPSTACFLTPGHGTDAPAVAMLVSQACFFDGSAASY